MSDLKQYWDNLSHEKTEEVSAEYSLDRVLTRIDRRRTALWVLAAVACFFALVPAGIVLFTRTPEPQLIQCYTPYGQQQMVTLADGSTVQMNSGSSLVYPDRFTSETRTVVFSGEAVFSVSKDKRHPFVVKAPGFEVEVKGTVFDLSAYPESEKSYVILSEGSVAVKRENSESTLTPGQKAELLKDGSISISSAIPSDYMNWTKGGFILQAADMSEIVALIQRSYGVKVQCSYSGKFDGTLITARSETTKPIEDFLNLLAELIPGMKYRISDNVVYIY